MKLIHGCVTPLVATTLILLSSGANAQEDIFKFKEPAPIEVVTTQQPAVDMNPSLSLQQTQQVVDMTVQLVKKMMDAQQLAPEKNGEVEIDGEQYILLSEGQSYTGISSGMYVIYDEANGDYDYHDSKKFKRVMPKAEYDKLIAEMKKNIAAFSPTLNPDAVQDEHPSSGDNAKVKKNTKPLQVNLKGNG